jgi:hypothetical protein
MPKTTINKDDQNTNQFRIYGTVTPAADAIGLGPYCYKSKCTLLGTIKSGFWLFSDSGGH